MGVGSSYKEKGLRNRVSYPTRQTHFELVSNGWISRYRNPQGRVEHLEEGEKEVLLIGTTVGMPTS